jgi:hypothetical protein
MSRKDPLVGRCSVELVGGWLFDGGVWWWELTVLRLGGQTWLIDEVRLDSMSDGGVVNSRC